MIYLYKESARGEGKQSANSICIAGNFPLLAGVLESITSNMAAIVEREEHKKLSCRKVGDLRPLRFVQNEFFEPQGDLIYLKFQMGAIGYLGEP